jgi:hypothetical protein
MVNDYAIKPIVLVDFMDVTGSAIVAPFLGECKGPLMVICSAIYGDAG